MIFMKTLKKKKNYEAPHLTVVTFMAEKGYALSTLKLLALSSLVAAQGSQSLESRVDGGSWGTGDWY